MQTAEGSFLLDNKRDTGGTLRPFSVFTLSHRLHSVLVADETIDSLSLADILIPTQRNR